MVDACLGFCRSALAVKQIMSEQEDVGTPLIPLAYTMALTSF